MKLIDTFILALKNIWTGKMRTFLTMLGIIIGIMAVIVIVGLGTGIEDYMADSFSSLGTDTLTVMIVGRGSSRTVSVDDMYEIVEKNPEYLSCVSPKVSVSGSVKIGTEVTSSSITGVSEEYFDMSGYDIEYGRGLQYMDIADRKSVCVIGKYVSDTYFNGDPLGKTIRVGKNQVTIVGVMAQEADEASEGGTDDCVYLPYSTAMRFGGSNSVSNYSITVTDEDYVSNAKKCVEDALFDIFRDSDAYSVISMSEILGIFNDMLDVVITVLTIIAGISLLVGGIGIMNIMLVSVSERTCEIGIRKALGAKERTILTQFIIEAAVTSGLGGLLGIGAGIGLCSVATVLVSALLDTPLTVVPTPWAITVAFCISAAVGILFGYLPAKKAASLNPIDAFRHD